MGNTEINPEKGCPNCGGQLEYDRQKKLYRCLYCRSQFPVFEQDQTSRHNEELLDPERFKIDVSLDLAKLKPEAMQTVQQISFCTDQLRTPEKILEYIYEEYLYDEDLAAPGIQEDLLAKIEGPVGSQLEPGEEIKLFIDDGIFFRGKSGYVLTDRRIFFCEKKWKTFVKYEDVKTIGVDGTCWYLNRTHANQISEIGAGNDLQGAVLALISAYTFEKDPEHTPIRVMKYTYAG